MKWTVRTDSNFMDHSIDLKKVKIQRSHALFMLVQAGTDRARENAPHKRPC